MGSVDYACILLVYHLSLFVVSWRNGGLQGHGRDRCIPCFLKAYFPLKCAVSTATWRLGALF